MSATIAVIGALPRELAGLTKGWPRLSAGRGVRLFRGRDVIVVCAGMGGGRAALAVEAAFAAAQVKVLISAGFAGACNPELQIGQVLRPGVVVETRTGERFQTAGADGLLASHHGVAGRKEKFRLRGTYGAGLVDMEAATVARLAQMRGVRFEALKVVSDLAEFDFPDMSGFITEEGGMREVAFGLHLLLRPRMWGGLRTLAQHSRVAQRALGAALRKRLESNEEEG